MIVTTVDREMSRWLGGTRPMPRWVCLARRGMLHSECEAVDFTVLPPGATLDRHGRDGVGELLFVVDGAAETGEGTPLSSGDLLVIAPDDTETRVTATSETRILTVAVLGSAAARLPRRRPDLLDRDGG